MTVDLDALEALLVRATPGPWGVHYATYRSQASIVKVTIADDGTEYRERYIGERVRDEEDAALIAAAVNALPALLAELRRLRGVEEKARAENAFLREWLRGELTLADVDIDAALRAALEQ